MLCSSPVMAAMTLLAKYMVSLRRVDVATRNMLSRQERLLLCDAQAPTRQPSGAPLFHDGLKSSVLCCFLTVECETCDVQSGRHGCNPGATQHSRQVLC